MKLELRHLAPYLPYGLKCVIEGTEDEILIIGILDETVDSSPMVYVEETNPLLLGGIQLLLRPLSDLTKEIEHSGEKFVPHHKLHLSANTKIESVNSFYSNGGWGLEDILWCNEKLFEWHFDVFGGIEAGWAIDINTLEHD